MFGDSSANALSDRVVRALARACCNAGATLYLIASPPAKLDSAAGHSSGSRKSPPMHFSRQTCLKGQTMPSPTAGRCDTQCPYCESCPASDEGIALRGPLHDDTLQRPYYESSELIDLIDVGLVWSDDAQPSRRFFADRFFNEHRPPTRMHWWWSHGIPTLALQRRTFLDAARRAGYPEGVSKLHTPEDVKSALHTIRCAKSRDCLRRRALHAAILAGPRAAAAELAKSTCQLLWARDSKGAV